MTHDRSRTPSRRDFLASGLAVTGALALGGRSALARPTPAGPYGPFKMGLQSYSLRHYKTEEALAKTKELGVHYWESYSAHTNPDPAKASEYKSLAAASGVEVIGFGVSGFSKDHEKNRKLFEFGKAMGLGYLSADPTPDAFDSLDKLVEEYGIAIGIHPHGPGSRWEKIDQIAAAIKDHNDKIGICLDTGHLLRSKEDPVRAVAVFGKRIYGVHLKDVKDAKTFTILGEGDLKLVELLKYLASLNYSYCLALEYEENASNPIADIQKCLEATRNAVAKIGT
jgi:sugar phosphate isomerase/epimerase